MNQDAINIPYRNHRFPHIPLMSLYPRSAQWQMWTFALAVIPFAICAYKYDLNVAAAAFLVVTTIISLISSCRNSEVTRRLRMGEREFLANFQQQMQTTNPHTQQDQSAMLRLYLTMMDRDFTENDYELLSALDEVNDKRGASSTQIESINSQKWTEKATDVPQNCPICLEAFISTQSFKTLPCSHKYHSGCIDQWLSRKPNCPVCKKEVF